MENVILSKKVNLKKIIRILCILCIAVLWVSIIAIAELYGGAFLKNNTLSLLVENKVYEKGYEYYQEQVKEAEKSVPVPLEQTFEVLSLRRFYIIKLNFAECALKGEKYEYDSSLLQDELSQYLKDYLSNEEQRSVQEEQMIDAYSMRAVNMFYDCANSTVLDSIYEMQVDFFNFIKWLLPILVFCIIQFVIALFYVHAKKIKAIQDICYASLGSILIAISIYIGMSIWLRPEQFMIGPDFYQGFVKGYIVQINQAFGYGIVFLSLLYCLLIAVKQLLKGYLKEIN